MRTLIILFTLFFCFASSPQPLLADEKPKTDKSHSKKIFKEFEDHLKTEGDTDHIITEKLDPMEKELQEILKKAEYEYDISTYKHRRESFDWQLASSIIIFWVVIIIVFVGLFFSGVQFYITMMQEKKKLKGDKKENTTEGKKDLSQTNIKASLKGIEVNSSVLGVIILIISLLFFYLYMVHVYPINEAGGEPKAKVSAKR